MESILPITLLGDNLGQRHRHLNSLVRVAKQSGASIQDVETLPEESPVDRLFKIDLATELQHVDYIIRNLKNDDMLYVSRALKSTWLINNRDIINPKYLEEVLFPEMISPAVTKMKHWLYINLRDPAMCQEFYQHYKENTFEFSIKFLSHCSQEFILEEVPKILSKISPQLLEVLCQRCPKVAKIYFDSLTADEEVKTLYLRQEQNYFNSVKCVLKSDADVFLEITEKHFNMNKFKRFSPLATNFILHHHKTRFMNKLELYVAYLLHIPTVAARLSVEECQEAVLKLARAKYLQHWFQYKIVEPLIKRLSPDKRAAFKKRVFVDKVFGECEEKWPYDTPTPPVESATGLHIFDDQEFTSNLSPMYAIRGPPGLFGAAAAFPAACMAPRSCNYMNSIRVKTDLDRLFDEFRFIGFDRALHELSQRLLATGSTDRRRDIFLVLVSKSGGRIDAVSALLNLAARYSNEPAHTRASVLRSLVKRASVWRLPDDVWQHLLDYGHGLGLDGTQPEAACREGLHAVVIRQLLAGKCEQAVKLAFMKGFSTLVEYSLKADERALVAIGLQNLLMEAAENVEPSVAAQRLVQLLDVLKIYRIKIEPTSPVVKAVVDLASRDAEVARPLLEQLYNARIARRELLKLNMEFRKDEAALVNALRHDPSALDLQRVVDILAVWPTDSCKIIPLATNVGNNSSNQPVVFGGVTAPQVGFASSVTQPVLSGSMPAPPMGLGSAPTNPFVYGSAAVPPMGFGSSFTQPVVSGIVQAPPVGLGSAPTIPLVFGSIATPPISSDNSSTQPIVSDSVGTPTISDNSSAQPVVSGSVATSPTGLSSSTDQQKIISSSADKPAGLQSPIEQPTDLGSAIVQPTGFGSSTGQQIGFGSSITQPMGIISGPVSICRPGFGSFAPRPTRFGHPYRPTLFRKFPARQTRFDKFISKLVIYFDQKQDFTERLRTALKEKVTQEQKIKLVRPLTSLMGNNFEKELKELDSTVKKNKKFAAALRACGHRARPVVNLAEWGWRKVGVRAVATRAMRCREVERTEIIRALATERRTVRVALALSMRSASGLLLDAFTSAAQLRPLVALRAALPYFRRYGSKSDLKVWDIVKPLFFSVDLVPHERLRRMLENTKWIPSAIKPDYCITLYLAFHKDSSYGAQSVLRDLSKLLPQIDESIEIILLKMLEDSDDDIPAVLCPSIFVRYLLLSKNEEDVERRFEKIGNRFLECLDKIRIERDYHFQSRLEEVLMSLKYNSAFLDTKISSCLSVIKRFLTWLETFKPKEENFKVYSQINLTMLYYKAVKQSMEQMPEVFSDPMRRKSEGVEAVGFNFGRNIAKEVAELVATYFDSIIELYKDALIDYLHNNLLYGTSRTKFVGFVIKGILTEAVGIQRRMAVYVFKDHQFIIEESVRKEIKELITKDSSLDLIVHAELCGQVFPYRSL